MYLDSPVYLYICSSICIYGKMTPVATCQWDAETDRKGWSVSP